MGCSAPRLFLSPRTIDAHLRGVFQDKPIQQNGGLDNDEMTTIKSQPAKSESALLKIVAEVVADHARPKYRQDVLDRKMTFATGSGTVHGDQYDISYWGIG